MLEDTLQIVTTALCGYLVWYLKGHVGKRDNLSRAMKILLRGEIYKLHRLYMRRGEIEPQELYEFRELCSVYRYFRGNGTGEKMEQDIVNLPLKEE